MTDTEFWVRLAHIRDELDTLIKEQAKEKPAPIERTGDSNCGLCYGLGTYIHPHNGEERRCGCGWIARLRARDAMVRAK